MINNIIMFVKYQSFRTVALYDTLGAEAAEFIVGHAECKAVV